MNPKKIKLAEEFLQLDRYLQAAGLASRREAERLIKDGRVTINGKHENRPFRRVKVTVEKVRLDGKLVILKTKHAYFAFNKPFGYLCSHGDPQGRRTIYEILPQDRHLFSVGRLDMNTGGMMIITSDGMLARRLEMPTYGLHRIYHVRIKGHIDRKQSERAKRGLVIDGTRFRPIKITKTSEWQGGDRLELKLTEGKYHEVRRVIEYFGLEIDFLLRISFGGITIDDLRPSEWRALSAEEVQMLKEKTGLL